MVRRLPRDSEPVDPALLHAGFSVGALLILHEELGFPGGAFVAEPLRILGIITVVMIPIGILGAVGVPLPWPFAPRWVVERRKKDRAARKGTTSGA